MHVDLSALFDLTGRVAVVTGGSRGLGRAMAIGLAKAGADVVVASRNLESCAAVCAEIETLGRRALPVAVRMGEPDDVRALVAAVDARFGRLDIVVNNAATVLDRSLDTLAHDTFVGAFTTNLFGPLLLVREAKDLLARGGHGAVLNICSIAMDIGTPERYYYPPVKAALAQATRSMALDLGPLGVRVNAISPGTFRTDMVTKAFDDAELARRSEVIPLGRVADPTELVGPALLLVSDAGSYITGEVLTVDAGATRVSA
ncbi:MAG: SDR family oxidoreductase [Actinobacteria bacterium]|nr:SDR family oxidoreductase [Actinomycetota bacterium]